MEGEELEKVHLQHKPLVKPCPGLRQQFWLLLVLKGCVRWGMQRHPGARGSICLSEQPGWRGGGDAQAPGFGGSALEEHLQFGVWMHVWKQPGHRSPDAGPCAAPLGATRAPVGSADEAWSYKNLVAWGCSPRFGDRQFAEQRSLRARAGPQLELCKENWVGAR